MAALLQPRMKKEGRLEHEVRAVKAPEVQHQHEARDQKTWNVTTAIQPIDKSTNLSIHFRGT